MFDISTPAIAVCCQNVLFDNVDLRKLTAWEKLYGFEPRLRRTFTFKIGKNSLFKGIEKVEKVAWLLNGILCFVPSYTKDWSLMQNVKFTIY